MANEDFSPEQVRAYMKDMLPKLNYWKRYAEFGGEEKFMCVLMKKNTLQ